MNVAANDAAAPADGIPVGLDGLRAAMKADAKNALWWGPWVWSSLDRLVYRCRYCRNVLVTGDASCPTCGAPKERQRGPA